MQTTLENFASIEQIAGRKVFWFTGQEGSKQQWCQKWPCLLLYVSEVAGVSSTFSRPSYL